MVTSPVDAFGSVPAWRSVLRSAVSVRRLHATGPTGWWLLIGVVLIVFLAQDGRPGSKRLDGNPREGSAPRIAAPAPGKPWAALPSP